VHLPMRWARWVLKKLKDVNSPEKDSAWNSLSKEMVDSLTFDHKKDKKMPDILPPEGEIIKMTPDEIEAWISTYTGLSMDDLHKCLYPKGLSNAGFLKDGDRIGQIILQDAKLLVDLGVSRHAMADLMRRVMAQSHDATNIVTIEDVSLETSYIHWMGYQSDPFHPTFGNPSEGCAEDYKVVNLKTRETLSFGQMLPSLIQRLCFFENTSYRVDPLKAARVLGLLVQKIDYLDK